jgi:protein phosphatase
MERLDSPENRLSVSLKTDLGCVRQINEDACRCRIPSDPQLLETKGVISLIADGMGGHSGGEVASSIAVDVITRAYYESKRSPRDALKQAFEIANQEIYHAAIADKALEGMGTTCTALVVCGEQAFAAHVGDSRLYLLREGEIYLMTEDHSAVMEMVKLGIITAEQARHHEDKNVIIRALGTSAAVEVALWETPMQVRDNDRFLLCSDGLYDLMEDVEIRDLVLNSVDHHSACEALVARARGRGGYDNITVGIVKVGGGYPAPRTVRETREAEVVL